MGSKGMEGWTSAGLSVKASEALEEMSNELHLNKREIATLAILSFQDSEDYEALKEKIGVYLELKAQFPTVFRIKD